ncbi:MAG: ABC transporter permease [Anaerolineae bacterium]|nr:ABC transporter permease [Chloroflexota bacterium]MBP6297706.1 ABC transporter permease [Anaerolineae bacterium]
MSWFVPITVLLLTVLGPAIAPNDPTQTRLGPVSAPPGDFILGTDTLGRDVLSRVLNGALPSLLTGGCAAIIAWLIGAIVGAASVLGPIALRLVVRTFTGALLALPSVVTALVIVTALGPGLGATALATGAAFAGVSSQVWSGLIQSVVKEPYIEGAQAVGAGWVHITWFYVLPNVFPSALHYAFALFATGLLFTSGLSFLGLNADPSSTDWGNLLAEGRTALRAAPWIMLAPTAALLAVTMALTSLGRLVSQRKWSSQPETLWH